VTREVVELVRFVGTVIRVRVVIEDVNGDMRFVGVRNDSSPSQDDELGFWEQVVAL
jgi:hypothetical protein